MRKINKEATKELFELVDKFRYDSTDLEKIKSLLSQGANPNYRQEDYPSETILYRVVSSWEEKERLEVVKLLVEYGGDLNLTSDIFYPIGNAVYEGDIVLVQFMLENGATEGLDDALHKAIERDHIDLVKLLITCDVDLHELKPYSKSLLVYCCEPYRVRDTKVQYEIQPGIEIAKLLLQKGIDPNGSNHNSTPLIQAIQHDFYELIELLLDNGAVAKSGIGISHHANTVEMFHFLVEKGVIKDLNEASHPQKITPLIYHTSIFSDFDIVKYLIANGADLYHTDIHKKTAFHYALWTENSAFIDYFLAIYDVKKCHEISSVFDGVDNKKVINKLKTVLV